MDKPGAASEGKGLKIIGAGFGRTGTMSLKVALEELGFSPCYHMIEVFERPADIAVWEGAAVGKPTNGRPQGSPPFTAPPPPLLYIYVTTAAGKAGSVSWHCFRSPNQWGV